MTIRRLGAAVGACVVLWAPHTWAEEGTQLELGPRLGYGIASGRVFDQSSAELSRVIQGQIPLVFDLGARINHIVFVGVYFSYGFGINGNEFADSCDELKAEVGPGPEISCSSHDLRMGFDVLVHLGQPGQADPWVGGGIGYEWAVAAIHLSEGSNDATVTDEWRGLEFPNLQAGVDFPLRRGTIGIGPFFMLTFGRYSTEEVDCSGDCGGLGSDSASIDDQAWHSWVLFGARSTFLF